MDVIATESQQSFRMLLKHGSIMVKVELTLVFNLKRVCLAPPFSEEMSNLKWTPCFTYSNTLIIDLHKIAHTFSIQVWCSCFIRDGIYDKGIARMNKEEEEGEVCRMDGNFYRGPW